MAGKGKRGRGINSLLQGFVQGYVLQKKLMRDEDKDAEDKRRWEEGAPLRAAQTQYYQGMGKRAMSQANLFDSKASGKGNGLSDEEMRNRWGGGVSTPDGKPPGTTAAPARGAPAPARAAPPAESAVPAGPAKSVKPPAFTTVRPEGFSSNATPPADKTSEVVAPPADTAERPNVLSANWVQNDPAVGNTSIDFTRSSDRSLRDWDGVPHSNDGFVYPHQLASNVPDDVTDADYYGSYAEGGLVRGAQGEDVPLSEALGAALRGVQNMYGLNQERAALPGSDPQQNEGVQAMAQNADAADPAEMQAILQAVNPDGSLSAGQANAAALQKIYGFYAGKGQKEEAESAAASVLQATRERSMRLGALATAAMEKGDFAGAGKALIAAYDQVPDGRDVEGQVDERGVGKAIVRDSQSGKVVQEMPITPEVMKVAAQRFMTGADFYQHLARNAAPSRQPSAGYANGGAVRPIKHFQSAGPVESDDREGDLMAEGAVGGQQESYAPAPDITARADAMTPPPPPRYIDMRGMSSPQMRAATQENTRRYQFWLQEMNQFRAMQGRRFTADRDLQNKALQSAQSDRNAVLSSQRQRQNGVTEEDVARRMIPLDQRYQAGRQIQRDIGRQGMANIPQYRMPGQDDLGITETMRMPEGLDRPRNAREAAIETRNNFYMEPFFRPEERALAIAGREATGQARNERDMRAVDFGAKIAQKKDRYGLEKDVKDLFDDQDNGIFVRPVQPGQNYDSRDLRDNNRVYIGNLIPPKERESLKMFTFKLAQFNPDLPVSSAAELAMTLTGVDPKKPDAAPNWSIKFNEEDGTGRVMLKDGSVGFNMDSESLQQVMLFREAKALQIKAQLAEEQGKEEQSKKFWSDARDLMSRVGSAAVEGASQFTDDFIVNNPTVGGVGRAVGGALGTAGRYIGEKFVDTYSQPNAEIPLNEYNDPMGFGVSPIR